MEPVVLGGLGVFRFGAVYPRGYPMIYLGALGAGLANSLSPSYTPAS